MGYTRDLGRQDGRNHHSRWPRRRAVRTGSLPLEAAVRPRHSVSIAALRRQGGRRSVVVRKTGAFTIVLLEVDGHALAPEAPRPADAVDVQFPIVRQIVT